MISGTQLRQIIDKIERLEEEKSAVQEAIKETFGEAKSKGFDVKIVREVLKIRKMDQQERSEQEELVDLYLHAINQQ